MAVTATERVARLVLALVGLAVVAVGATSCSSTASPEATKSASPTASALPKCPDADGGLCLGPLKPGTYTTQALVPTLTYTVPTGWRNVEDNGGNFLLLPPNNDLAGIDGNSSDFIGVFPNVWPAEDCDSDIPENVAHTPAAFVQWLQKNAGFRVTGKKAVTVGGLPGYVVDLRMAPTWTKQCSYSNGAPLVPLMTGREPTELDHNVIAHQLTRLYLLADTYGVLAIEAVDIHDANTADTYSALIDTFRFHSAT